MKILNPFNLKIIFAFFIKEQFLIKVLASPLAIDEDTNIF